MGKFFITLGTVLVIIGIARIILALCAKKETNHTEKTNDEQK